MLMHLQEAIAYFESERYNDFCARRLPHVDEVVLDWAAGPDRPRTGHAGVARCSAIELPPSTTRYCPVM